MKKAFAVCLATLITLSLCTAGAAVQEVTAYQNESIIVTYGGMQIPFSSAPIMYNGQLYLPAGEFCTFLGVGTRWDPALNTFTIGESAAAGSKALDFINDLAPYQSDGVGFQIVKTSDRQTMNIGGVACDHWLRLYDSLRGSAEAYYNLGGAYTALTFSGYYDHNGTVTVDFYGDNDVLLTTVSLKGYDLPQQFTVDLTNVYRLKITTEDWYIYLFDMTIE